MRRRLRIILGLWILLWSALGLYAASVWKSFYPYLTFEKNLVTRDITGKDRYDFDINYKQMNGAALGLIFQNSFFSTSVSLVAPWRKSEFGSSSVHPGLDLNLAFQMKNVYVYGGYFTSFRKENLWDKEKIMPQIYTGIGLKRQIDKMSLDFGFQASWRRYTDYWQLSGPKRTIASCALATKIGYDIQKVIHPFLSFSAEKSNASDKLGIRLAIGITIGKKMPTTQAYPIIVNQTAIGIVKKPNIYLYPEKEERITVTVNPNGKITASDPPYNEGWQVTAHPDGSIDHTSGFLFYEALVTVNPLQEGWCVSSDKTDSFFKTILADYGFREKEISDFLEYWAPKLSESPYCIVQPLLNEDVERICPLHVTPEPDQILRVWFVFKPSAKDVSLEEPKISPFLRSGFVVTEWGGIMR